MVPEISTEFLSNIQVDFMLKIIKQRLISPFLLSSIVCTTGSTKAKKCAQNFGRKMLWN